MQVEQAEHERDDRIAVAELRDVRERDRGTGKEAFEIDRRAKAKYAIQESEAE